MIINAYIFCGMLYSIYTFQKIFSKYEQFVSIFEEQFGKEGNINIFFAILFANCLIGWPIMVVQEINNIQDL